MSNSDSTGGGDPKRPCPICGKPLDASWQPFCSKRCADVDLNRWLSGSYAVPAEPDDERPDEEGGRDESQTRH